MNMCRHHGIDLWQVEKGEKFSFSLYVKDYKQIRTIVKKTGIRPHIEKKTGVPFLWHWLIENWTFSSGFLFFLILLAIMSSYVWEISFQGQSTYTKETLLKTVNEMGVHRGMKRSRLFCDDIEKNIRERYSDISWVSAEEKGSRLVISLKEAEKLVPRQSEEMPCHLVATEEGVVKEIAVNRGVAVVKKGQKVKKGQILIEGIVPITDDGDQVIEKIPVAAKGTVKIYVEQNISEKVSVKKKVKQYTGKTIYLYDWQAGGESISLKNPFKRFNNSYKYDIIGTKKLNYKLQPFSFAVAMDQYECREYEWKTISLNEKQLEEEGRERYERRKREIESAGHTLLSHTAQMKKLNVSTWELSGRLGYLCEDTRKKYIQEKEWQVERKAEEANDGET